MPTLAERSLRVALLGVVPEDDPHIIADMQAEIERAQAERALLKRQVALLQELGRNLLELVEGMVPECEPEELPTVARIRSVLGKARAARRIAAVLGIAHTSTMGEGKDG